MEGSVKELAVYRFRKAEDSLNTAKQLVLDGNFDFALNRAYYAIFHALRAVNALDGFDSSKHSVVIAYFNQNHVKNGDFEKEISKIIRSASELREQSDYEDFFVAEEEDAVSSIRNAEILISSVKQYLIEKQIL